MGSGGPGAEDTSSGQKPRLCVALLLNLQLPLLHIVLGLSQQAKSDGSALQLSLQAPFLLKAAWNEQLDTESMKKLIRKGP